MEVATEPSVAERDEEPSSVMEEVSVGVESSASSVLVMLIGTFPTTESALLASRASMRVAEVLRASESYLQADELTFLRTIFLLAQRSSFVGRG